MSRILHIVAFFATMGSAVAGILIGVDLLTVLVVATCNGAAVTAASAVLLSWMARRGS